MLSRILKYFLSVILLLLIILFLNFMFLIFKIKNVNGNIEYDIVKILLIQKVPYYLWAGDLNLIGKSTNNKDLEHRVNFYYTLIVLSADKFKYYSEAGLVLFELIKKEDRKYIYMKLNGYILTNQYVNLSLEEKEEIQTWIIILKDTMKEI